MYVRARMAAPQLAYLGLDLAFVDWRRYSLADRADLYEKPRFENRRVHYRCAQALRKLRALELGADYAARGGKVLLVSRKAKRAFHDARRLLLAFLRDAIFIVKSIPCVLAGAMPSNLKVGFQYMELHAAERRLSDALMSAADADVHCAFFERTIGHMFTDRADYMYPLREDLVKVRDRMVEYRRALEVDRSASIPPQLAGDCARIDRFLALDARACVTGDGAEAEEIIEFYEELLAKKDACIYKT
jgi:hypothetical protein